LKTSEYKYAKAGMATPRIAAPRNPKAIYNHSGRLALKIFNSVADCAFDI